MRKIIHVDMDAFFASVEQREDPSLRGKAIAVGYDGPRGVVSTASYEARKYGVHSAQAIAKAKQLCPHIIIVPCHFQLYKEISAQVREIMLDYTDIIEPLSLDEAFLDVTVNKVGYEYARDIAREIKQRIFEKTQLTASAGVSYNKFLAKIASDYHKPDGLTVIHPLRASAFIESLKIEDFWGVGPKTAQKMHKLGIYNGLQLKNCTLDHLTHHFGKAGRIYYNFARGIDDRQVEPVRIRKSVGCEETYLQDIYDDQEIARNLDALIEDLLSRIEKAKFKGRTLTVKIKYFDFVQITRSITSESFYVERSAIKEAVDEIMSDIDYSQQRPIRLLGLSVSHPETTIQKQFSTPIISYPTLFDNLDLL